MNEYLAIFSGPFNAFKEKTVWRDIMIHKQDAEKNTGFPYKQGVISPFFINLEKFFLKGVVIISVY